MDSRTHRFSTVDSTNAKAKELASAGAPAGTAVLAERQTAGRGRGEHRWHSPEGGIYLSVLVAQVTGRSLTDLSFLGGVALTRVVRELLPPAVPVTVKWPNDCLAGGRKIGGVLGEAAGGTRPGLGIVGIGLNGTTSAAELDAFQAQPFGATSLALSGAGLVDVGAVGERLAQAVRDLAGRYHEGGFLPVQRLWERHCLFLRRRVRVQAETLLEGVCLGIDDDGALVLSTPEGERRKIHSGQLVGIE